MSRQPITVTREELYEQAWSKSMVKLAGEYGVSDVAIAKACKRLNVPRPPVGHWAKVEAGRRAVRAPLPAVSDGVPLSTTIPGERKYCAKKPRTKVSEIASENLPTHDPVYPWMHEWRQQQRRREELAQRLKAERERRIQLMQAAASWQQGESLHAFCNELQQRVRAAPGQFDKKRVAMWLAWARSIAAKYDPIENGYFAQAVAHDDLNATLDCS